jgi:tellurite resistance protein TehA-like permease
MAALVAFALGLVLYAAVIARFDVRQLAVGRGDHWVTGGALGISALAAERITTVAGALDALGGLRPALKDITLALWILTMLWLLVLLVVEARWPRLAFDDRRWSTVFPLGMYSACSFAVGTLEGAGGIVDFARVCVWVALAAWALVAAETVRRLTSGAAAASSSAPSSRPARATP